MKLIKLLPISLILVMGIVGAKNQCVRPYNITVVNKSGGVATFLGGREVAGMRKGARLDNGRKTQLEVRDMGAHVKFEVGPEEQKQNVSVTLHDVVGAHPRIDLEPKMAKVFDVNTMHGKSYEVTVRNESGGIATVNGCSAREMKIANRSNGKLHVHAGATATVIVGQEKNKKSYVINFFEQTDKPSVITLAKGEFFTNGIKAKGVNIKVHNAVLGRLSQNLGPKKRQAMPAQQAQPMKNQPKHMKPAVKPYATKG